MQERPNELDATSDVKRTVSEESGREVVVDNTNDSPFASDAYSHYETLRSYRDVYQKVRHALEHPVEWRKCQIQRIQISYGLPIAWSALGCVIGIGFVLIHQSISPTVNLPSNQKMNAIFALHDLNELFLASNQAVRTKS